MIVVAGTAAAATVTDGPPPGLAPSLTSNGRVTWNLDALMNDTFGHRTPCYDGKGVTIFSVARGRDCAGPGTGYTPYMFTFTHAHHSQFRLVQLAKEPLVGVTNVLLRIKKRYVSCPNGLYHHGRRGWLVFGGGGPWPGSWFWCN